MVPDSWDAGWQATVNGRSAPVLRANYDQQAVAVPPGDVRVTLRYRPPGLRLGGLLSLLGVLAVAVLLVAPWGRSRRRSPGRSRRRSPGRTRGRHRMSPDTAIGTAEQPEVLTSSGAGAPARTASPSS